MDLSDIPVAYTGQDLKVQFACFQDDGTTPMNLSGGGLAEVTLRRTGLKPYTITETSDSPDQIEWISQSLGTGILTIPLQDEEDLPLGMIRLQLRAQSSDGQSEIQYQGWLRVLENLTPSLAA